MGKRMIFLILALLFLVNAPAFSKDLVEEVNESEQKAMSFWQKVYNAILYPLEKLDDMIYHKPDRYADDVFSDDPQRSLDATDRYVEEWQEIPEDAKWVAEQGVDELSGPAGKIRGAKDFVDRFGKGPYQGKPGLPKRQQAKKQGLDADFIKRIYKEMDEEEAERRRRQLEEAEALSAEIDKDIETTSQPLPEESAGTSTEKKPPHPCKIDKRHPECRKLIRKTLQRGIK